MRHAFALALLLAACSSNNLPGGGDTLDLAGCAPNCPDLASADSAVPAPDFSASDLSDLVCVTFCNHCTLGGACCPGAPNGGCCGSGEWCDNGACRCGSGPGCTGGEICSTGGPAMGPGGNQCGMICCGGANHPCPL